MTTIEAPVLSVQALAIEAAEQLKLMTGVDHRVAVVFGTGWDAALPELGPDGFEESMVNLPGFSAPTIEGHAGKIHSLRIGPNNVLVFRGRRHRYEFEYDNYECLDAITYNVRVAQAAGCDTIILTNAVGGINPSFQIGQPILIRSQNDAITAAPCPIRGHFQPCAKMFDYELIDVCRSVERWMPTGVYAQVRGPNFETEAVAQFMWDNHIDLVGMSIIQEAQLAHHLGMRILGISLVTDMAGDDTSHAEVQAVVRQQAPYLGGFLRQVIEQI